mmetsp:Transcript_13376/g.20908  ORF Transcript_13376/g.20908 Transcript_13376/m.20908 type:complete len:90 (+) Transcript_13376:607-876(+)
MMSPISISQQEFNRMQILQNSREFNRSSLLEHKSQIGKISSGPPDLQTPHIDEGQVENIINNAHVTTISISQKIAPQFDGQSKKPVSSK